MAKLIPLLFMQLQLLVETAYETSTPVEAVESTIRRANTVA